MDQSFERMFAFVSLVYLLDIKRCPVQVPVFPNSSAECFGVKVTPQTPHDTTSRH